MKPSAGRDHDAEEVEGPGHHGKQGRKAVGINYRRDRIGGIVKSVHELEAQSDKQGQGQHGEGARRQGLARALDVVDKFYAGKAEAAGQTQKKQQSAAYMRLVIQFGAAGDAVIGGQSNVSRRLVPDLSADLGHGRTVS